MVMGILVVALYSAGVAEAAPGVGPGGVVAGALSGGHGGLLGGFPVMPVRLPVEVIRQRPGKLPGVGVEAFARGEADGGEQDLALGLEPGHGLPVVSKTCRGGTRLGQVRADRG